MNAQELVRMHVMSNQGLVIEQLLRNGSIDEEPLYSAEHEIMQWWLVTPYLAERLRAQGEIIIDDLGVNGGHDNLVDREYTWMR